MVFVFVPPTKGAGKSSRRQNAAGLFLAAMIALGFAIFVVFLGPKNGPPPPPIVKWALVGLAVVFSFVGFFSWLRHQGDVESQEEEQHSQEEQ